jgi:hypothetical protein
VALAGSTRQRLSTRFTAAVFRFRQLRLRRVDDDGLMGFPAAGGGLCHSEQVETKELKRPHWQYNIAAFVIAGAVTLAWLVLWEYVLTPFDRGTYLDHLGGGLGTIAVLWALVRAVPALWKQANHDMTRRGMIILTAVAVLTIVGLSW